MIGKMPRLAREKMLPPLIAASAGLICYALFVNRSLDLSVIGYSVAPAERVLAGEVPYRDFLFNYTPGVLFVNALLMKTFGVTLMVTRLGLLAFKLLTLMTLFHVARRLTSAWGALIPVALTLCWLGHRQIFNVYPDQYLILFALLGLVSMLNFTRSANVWWAALSGMAIGIALIFKHNVGLYLFAAGAVAMALNYVMTSDGPLFQNPRKREVITGFLAFLIGFGIIAGSLVMYLAYNDALGAMINHFLHHALEYREARSVGLPPLSSIAIASLGLIIGIAGGLIILRKAPGSFLLYSSFMLALISLGLLFPGRASRLKESAIASVAYFPPVFFAAALGLTFWQLGKRIANQIERRKWWARNGDISIAGLFAIGEYLEVFPRADHYHLVRVLPPVMLFLYLVTARSLPDLKRYFQKRLPSSDQAAILVCSAPFLLLAIIGLLDTWRPQFDSSFHLKDRTGLSMERGRGILVERRQAELAQGLVEMVEHNSAADDFIFSFSRRGSGAYFLAGRRNPSRLLWWSSVGITEDDRKAALTMIDLKIPKLIIIQEIPQNLGLVDQISHGYVHIGTISDIAVYDRITR